MAPSSVYRSCASSLYSLWETHEISLNSEQDFTNISASDNPSLVLLPCYSRHFTTPQGWAGPLDLIEPLWVFKIFLMCIHLLILCVEGMSTCTCYIMYATASMHVESKGKIAGVSPLLASCAIRLEGKSSPFHSLSPLDSPSGYSIQFIYLISRSYD